MSRTTYDRVSDAYRAGRSAPDATVAEQREAFARLVGPAPSDVTATAGGLGGRPAIRLSPTEGADAGALLYLHGGGYVVGSARTGAPIAAALARRTGTTAWSLDYGLAPEHRFPQPVDDALAAYRELLDAVGPERLLIAGDSAGGGLAIATLVAGRAHGLPMPAAVAVFSPWADLTLSGASIVEREGDDPLFTFDDLRRYADHVLPETDPAGAAASPLASPVFADLRGLPPLLVQVGSRELLLDDALRLAANAARADVDVVLEVAARAPHNIQLLVGSLEEADRALERAGDFLAARLPATADALR
ncbi:alpha/beta hydrolase [Agromyces larvae]|uniref:Alpha/beta hydrolase n=1 Tax=Agromyces larvae TaxID=2929802 RepID=A0ABY4BZQ6_9MICO|nr:alpha/beta hydrolase [Agromyces larvae]UOE44677.1 alpha/beta hydrolase [Agromyces larvae]